MKTPSDTSKKRQRKGGNIKQDMGNPKICKNPECRKIIVRDWEKWLEENPNAAYIQCPYCFGMERIRWTFTD